MFLLVSAEAVLGRTRTQTRMLRWTERKTVGDCRKTVPSSITNHCSLERYFRKTQLRAKRQTSRATG